MNGGHLSLGVEDCSMSPGNPTRIAVRQLKLAFTPHDLILAIYLMEAAGGGGVIFAPDKLKNTSPVEFVRLQTA
jgi:hypothetical protein